MFQCYVYTTSILHPYCTPGKKCTINRQVHMLQGRVETNLHARPFYLFSSKAVSCAAYRSTMCWWSYSRCIVCSICSCEIRMSGMSTENVPCKSHSCATNHLKVKKAVKWWKNHVMSCVCLRGPIAEVFNWKFNFPVEFCDYKIGYWVFQVFFENGFTK